MLTGWPHDPRGGWSFSVIVPSWTTRTHDSETTVLHRVEVGVQSPAGTTTKRAIFRRYSEFRRLFLLLKEAFPRKRLPQPPPRQRPFEGLFRGGGKAKATGEAAVHERRAALEEWLWKLLGDQDISRSRAMGGFLELAPAARCCAAAALRWDVDERELLAAAQSAALAEVPGGAGASVGGQAQARRRARDPTVALMLAATKSESMMGGAGAEAAQGKHSSVQGAAAGPSTPSRGAGRAEDGERDWAAVRGTASASVSSDAGSSEASTSMSTAPAASPAIPAAFNEMQRALAAPRGREEPAAARGAAAAAPPPLDPDGGGLFDSDGPDSELLEARPSAFGPSASTGDEEATMALPAESRARVRRALSALRSRAASAQGDISALSDALGAANDEVARLKTALDAASADGEQRAQLLQSAAQAAEAELEAERARAAAADERAMAAERDASAAREAAEVAARELAEVRVAAEADRARLEGALTEAQAGKAAAEARVKAERKVLAGEIKSLRRAAEARDAELSSAQATAAEAAAAREGLVQGDVTAAARWRSTLKEVSALRQRMEACGVERLAVEDAEAAQQQPQGSEGGGEGAQVPATAAPLVGGETDRNVELLAKSDMRIGVLLAEAQLIADGDTPKASGEGEGAAAGASPDAEELREAEAAVRRALAEVLTDNASLRRVQNGLMRHALQSAEAGASPLLNGSSGSSGGNGAVEGAVVGRLGERAASMFGRLLSAGQS